MQSPQVVGRHGLAIEGVAPDRFLRHGLQSSSASRFTEHTASTTREICSVVEILRSVRGTSWHRQRIDEVSGPSPPPPLASRQARSQAGTSGQPKALCGPATLLTGIRGPSAGNAHDLLSLWRFAQSQNSARRSPRTASKLHSS